ncbi:MAG TPA: hypothetical protein VN896_02305, partial [Methylomirabilota bacterium]|nr:hypothetical protein [Methylomirabilota bacterium]
MTNRIANRAGLSLLLSALALLGACAARNASSPKPTRQSEATLAHVESFYTQLLAIRRPDLAAAYGLPPKNETFEPLSESDLVTHVEDLNLMLADLDK